MDSDSEFFMKWFASPLVLDPFTIKQVLQYPQECSVTLLTDNPRFPSLLMLLILGKDCHQIVLLCPLSHNLFPSASHNPDQLSKEFC